MGQYRFRFCPVLSTTDRSLRCDLAAHNQPGWIHPFIHTLRLRKRDSPLVDAHVDRRTHRSRNRKLVHILPAYRQTPLIVSGTTIFIEYTTTIALRRLLDADVESFIRGKLIFETTPCIKQGALTLAFSIWLRHRNIDIGDCITPVDVVDDVFQYISFLC